MQSHQRAPLEAHTKGNRKPTCAHSSLSLPLPATLSGSFVPTPCTHMHTLACSLARPHTKTPSTHYLMHLHATGGENPPTELLPQRQSTVCFLPRSALERGRQSLSTLLGPTPVLIPMTTSEVTIASRNKAAWLFHQVNFQT